MFSLIASIVFGILAVLWTKETLHDTALKVVLFALTIWGVIETALFFGYMVKV